MRQTDNSTETLSSDDRFRCKLARLQEEIGKVIVGQEGLIKAILCAFLARGHVLLEGVPGLAKSLTVSTFARTLGGTFNRIQFTPDKLPGDITGTTVFEDATSSFVFHEGPVFCHILLADEINRAAPKVQSALLEAMQEKVVSVDRERRSLPELFMVLATQNPVEQLGTYPLSEAQLDRFMVKLDVTYLSRAQEADLLLRKSRDFDALSKGLKQVLTPEEAVLMQNHVARTVRVSEPVIAYILQLCRRTRPQEPDCGQWTTSYIAVGASPRAAEHLMAFCKSYAFIQGRDYLSFADVDACAASVLAHRIILRDAAILEGLSGAAILKEISRSISPYDGV